VTTPFHFNRAIKVASLRVGVDPNAPKELVEQLKAIGIVPKDIGARPTVAGAGNGLNTEYAAAFDEYVQRKAKEIGLDLTTLPEPNAGRGGRGNAPVDTAAARAAAAAAAAAATANPMAPADWNPRFVTGRTVRAFDFLQSQRRRYMLIAKWGEFMKDLDMFVGGPNADVGPNAQTGHPCAVLPYKFDVPQQFGGGRGGAAAPQPELKAQPICGVITGNLYADDLILSVAHLVQEHNALHLKRPELA